MPVQGPCTVCGQKSLTKHKPVGLDVAFGGRGVQSMRRALRRAGVTFHFARPDAAVVCFTLRRCYKNLRDALIAADAYTVQVRQKAVHEVTALKTSFGAPLVARKGHDFGEALGDGEGAPDEQHEAMEVVVSDGEEEAAEAALPRSPKGVCGTPHCGLSHGHPGLCSAEVVAEGARRACRALARPPTAPLPATEEESEDDCAANRAAALPLHGSDSSRDKWADEAKARGERGEVAVPNSSSSQQQVEQPRTPNPNPRP